MAADRFNWIEDGSGDFPFYNGRPVAISGRQWVFVMAMVALGFAALATPMLAFTGRLAVNLAVLLFAGLPLVALAIVAPAHWSALFRRVGWHEIKWMLLFGLANLLVTLGLGMLVSQFSRVNANEAFGTMGGMAPPDLLLFVARSAPQLLGEELITVLPFLAVLSLLTSRGLGRREAVVWAWVASALLFGALHLPTYGWNVVQCLVIIGSARLILTLAYIKTKNIWVSTGAHIVNDWIMFGIVMLAAGA